MPKPPEPPEVIQARRERAEKGLPHAALIAPAVRLDLTRIMPGVEAMIDEFIADREAAGLPPPERQAMLERATNILGNIDPTKVGGINSLERNKRITIHHRGEPPHFAMGTES